MKCHLCQDSPRPIEKKIIPNKIEKLGRRARKRNRKNLRNSNNENMSNQTSASRGNSLDRISDSRVAKKKSRPVLSNTQVAKVSASVKHYSPLSIYVRLALEPLDLYKRLSFYVLSSDDLANNGYPRFSKDIPGVMVYNKGLFCTTSDNRNQRFCCRCRYTYQVCEDGTYMSEFLCMYHSGKKLANGCYSCCGCSTKQGCKIVDRHISAETVLNHIKYFQTREKRHSPSSTQVYALDCEMCYTVQGLEVTRVSVVASDGTTVYDSFVVPGNPIVDYVTEYSGVTAKDLINVTTTLVDVQAFLLKLLSSSTILIGHSLQNDLKALGIIHETVVDTSVSFPHRIGFPYKRSLKSLVATTLNQSIQNTAAGHNSVEDARACMELMLWKVEQEKHLFEKRELFQQQEEEGDQWEEELWKGRLWEQELLEEQLWKEKQWSQQQDPLQMSAELKQQMYVTYAAPTYWHFSNMMPYFSSFVPPGSSTCNMY